MFIGAGVYYTYRQDGREAKRLETIKEEPRSETKNVVIAPEPMKLENYKDVLFSSRQLIHKMKTIRSINHQLGSYEISKVSLSCFGDKRYLPDDGINSYAYGHS